MDASALDPSAPLCCCGDRGCAKPGHQLAFMEFIPFHKRPNRKAMRRGKGERRRKKY
jgi:hypothetical protein